MDEAKNYIIEEIKQNKLMGRKHKKVCTIVNYIEHFSYFSLYNYKMYFDSCFCFSDWYPVRNYEICSMIKILCSNCRNLKILIGN